MTKNEKFSTAFSYKATYLPLLIGLSVKRHQCCHELPLECLQSLEYRTGRERKQTGYRPSRPESSKEREIAHGSTVCSCFSGHDAVIATKLLSSEQCYK